MSPLFVLLDVFFTFQRYTHDLFESHIVILLVWLRFYWRFLYPSPAHLCSNAVVLLDTLYEKAFYGESDKSLYTNDGYQKGQIWRCML